MLTVMTMGSFDPPHEGHRRLFMTMRKLAGSGGRTVVGVNTDAFYSDCRGQPPLVGEVERVERIGRMGVVDHVFLNPGGVAQPQAMIDERINVFVNGLDWAHDGWLSQIGVSALGGWEWFTDNGITVAFVPRHGDWSATVIREQWIRAQEAAGQ